MPALTDQELRRLQDLARKAAASAYAPYSSFAVGAAILTEDGATYTGCNVENASYPLGMCAERNAIGQMVALGGKKIIAVVVYTPTPEPASPCGGCRQVINEFGPHAHIYSYCDGPEVLSAPLPTLLPHAFGPHNLSK